jgi:predicted RecB family nuclease
MPGEKLLEQKLTHPRIPEFGGTVDCIIQNGDSITLVDLKTGRWPVKVDGNPQLQCYALLVRDAIKHSGPIVTAIIQPRVYNAPQVTVFYPDELDIFEERVKIAGESDERVAGEHCRFCPLKESCDTYASSKIETKVG